MSILTMQADLKNPGELRSIREARRPARSFSRALPRKYTTITVPSAARAEGRRAVNSVTSPTGILARAMSQKYRGGFSL